MSTTIKNRPVPQNGGDVDSWGTPSVNLFTESAYNMAAYENVMYHGAVGNGVADDAAAINTAISTAISRGVGLFFPPGEYKILSSLSTITAAMHVKGAGNKTILKPTNCDVFTTNVRGCVFSDFMIQGNAYDGTARGIVVYNSTEATDTQTRIFNVRATLLNTGIYLKNSSNSDFNGSTLVGVIADHCSIGIHFDQRAEYGTVSGCQVYQNLTGIKIKAGNCNVSNCNITINNTGIHLVTGDNDAHGIINGCAINHNLTQGILQDDNMVVGEELVSNCQFYSNGSGGTVHITQGTGTNNDMHIRDCYGNGTLITEQ